MAGNAGQALQPGQTLGHYRVVDRIGRGGMGVVYRGIDTRFGRDVAIKAIEGDIATNPFTRRRFLMETQNAPRVVHPFVATVFDVIDRDEGPLLVMEYVDGRRLDHVLREGPLSPEKAKRYTQEIAEALVAIHSCGMVHRDLKPANVFITAQDHVKVMDFGVALRTRAFQRGELPTLDGPERVTASGHVVGTLAYMAPEQLKGQETDSRADLFSLGIVLWEELTGRHPFLGATSEVTGGAILHAPPGTDAERRQVADSGPIGEIALDLLHKDPEKRLQSAEEVVRLLRAVTDVGAGASRTKRRVAAAVFAAVLAIAAGAIAYLATRFSPMPPRIASRPIVAVLPLEGPAAGADGERGRMVAELLGAALGETPNVRPLDPARIDDVLSALPKDASRTERIARLARVARPSWIVTGTLYEEGNELVAAVQVHETGTDDVRGSVQLRSRRASDLALALAPRVRDITGAPALAGFGVDGGSTVIPDSDDEVQALYHRARRMFAERDFAKAITLLERALDRDPGFIDARILLADVLQRAGYERRARETIQAARRSIASDRLPETSRQVLYAEVVYARCTDQALLHEALKRFADARSDDPGPAADLSLALRGVGRPQDALTWAERAVSLDPIDGRGHMARALALHSVGRPEEALEEIDETVDHARELELPGLVAEAVESRAYLAYVEGRLEEARSGYVEAQALFEKAGLPVRALVAVQSQADMDLLAWRLTRAEPLYGRAVQGLREAGHYSRVVGALAGLGGALLRQGRLHDAEARIREAVDDARKLGSERLLTAPLSNLAVLLNETGRWEESRKASLEVLAIATSGAQRGARCTAEINLAWADYGGGRLRESLERLQSLADGRSQGDCAPDRIGSALGYLGFFLGRSENVAGALTALDRGVKTLEPTGLDLELAFLLADRAASLATVGDLAASEIDLERAGRLAATQSPPPPQLDDALRNARVELATARGDWRTAALLATPGSLSFGAAVPGIDLRRSEALLRTGDPSAAAAAARQAAARREASAVDRAGARLALALSLRGQGDKKGASRAAREAIREAERLDLPFTVARAAALIVDLEPTAPDAPSLRALGSGRLARFLETVPAGRREYVRGRQDVAEVLSVLERKRAS